MARVKKKDYENLTSTNIEKVIAHLTADQPISKKEACGMLNIAYNTARLQRIIDDHEDKKLYRAKRKAQNKGRAASSAEIAEGFGTTTIEMKGGALFAGVVTKDQDGAITLVDINGKSHQLVWDKIKSRSPSKESAMPMMGGSLTKRQLRDLIAFLKKQNK